MCRVRPRAIGLVERRVMRRRAAGAWLLVLVIALSAGAVMALVAGGRRAATSYDRLIEWSDPWDAQLAGQTFDSSEATKAGFDEIAALSMVEHATRAMGLGD